MLDSVRIISGVPSRLRRQAALLYYQAFREKVDALELKPGSVRQAVRLYTASLDLDSALAAVKGHHLAGLAGLTTRTSRFLQVPWPLLVQEFGFWRALSRRMNLAIEHMHKPDPDEQHLDTLAVRASCRNRGIGTTLLREVIARAHADGFGKVTLAVVNTNSAARRLYEREGFRAVRTRHYGWLTSRGGFTSVTKMQRDLAVQAPGL